ncbi:MAG: tRNA pseudouridine(55) synthase TruB [Clostridia bacterium]|nr:tRNA pseudouridine(55) synthase TruB [Clostridia bacterium]
MKGFINLLKPEGMSSAYAVTSVKKKFNMPCGHMGTLDPMASGVLPVGLGHTSRMFDYLLDKSKTYKAQFQFGYTTDTLDVTGQTTDKTSVIPTKEQIEKALGDFIGEIDQIPPKYSAKCVNGKRGYQLARSGVEFELQPKRVCILDFTLDNQIDQNTFEFTIKCKGGTYIRSLARDVGEKVNSLGVMSKLARVQSGIFNLDNGVWVTDLIDSDNPQKYLIPPENAVDFPIARLTDRQATRILNGLFDNLGYADGLYRVFNQNEFWGIGQSKDGILRIKAYVR